jgi:hypothetical protein
VHCPNASLLSRTKLEEGCPHNELSSPSLVLPSSGLASLFHTLIF